MIVHTFPSLGSSVFQHVLIRFQLISYLVFKIVVKASKKRVENNVSLLAMIMFPQMERAVILFVQIQNNTFRFQLRLVSQHAMIQ